jgi:hypothetical protein
MLSEALPAGPIWDEDYGRNRFAVWGHRSEACDWHQQAWSRMKEEAENEHLSVPQAGKERQA